MQIVRQSTTISSMCNNNYNAIPDSLPENSGQNRAFMSTRSGLGSFAKSSTTRPVLLLMVFGFTVGAFVAFRRETIGSGRAHVESVPLHSLHGRSVSPYERWAPFRASRYHEKYRATSTDVQVPNWYQRNTASRYHTGRRYGNLKTTNPRAVSAYDYAARAYGIPYHR